MIEFQCLILYYSSLAVATISTKISSNVIDLTDSSDFNASLLDNDTVLVMYFSSHESSEQSRIIEPQFETAATLLKSIEFPVALAKVDCNADLTGKQICSDNEIFVTPTLIIYKGGEFFQVYDGLRGAYDIFNHMKAKVGPNSSLCNTFEELDNALANAQQVIVLGIFLKDETHSNDLIKQFLVASDRLRYSATFIHTFIDSVPNVYDTDSLSCIQEKPVPNIILIRPVYMRNKYEPHCVALYSVNNDLKDFITNNYHGLVGHRTADNKQDFKLPRIVVYLSNVEFFDTNHTETDNYRDIIVKVAHNYKHITFAMSNAFAFENELRECGFWPIDTFLSSGPAVVCGRKESDQKFPMYHEFTEENFRQFVKNFDNELLEPLIISEPIPDNNKNAYVKVAVAYNFEELVINSDKDTLLQIYSPDCRYCKLFEPIYEELGRTLFGEPGVQIVKINYARNDMPSMFVVHGFPTIYWYSKSKLLKRYDHNREVIDFIRFIAKHSTNELMHYDRNGIRREPKQEL